MKYLLSILLLIAGLGYSQEATHLGNLIVTTNVTVGGNLTVSTNLVVAGTLTGNGSGLTNTGGYLMTFPLVATSNPADATTYYVGATLAAGAATWTGANGGTVFTNYSVRIPKSGRAKSLWVKGRVLTTVGSNEATVHSMRLNDTTDFGSVSFGYDVIAPSGLSTFDQAVTAGDTIAMKVVCPTWVTNPIGIVMFGELWIEY